MRNDNRKYSFPEDYSEVRKEYGIIKEIIPHDSKVVDLGCGNGLLLEILKKEKSICETGIDNSEEGVSLCKKKGLNVILGEIDQKLPFEDNEFDYSICNVTIQMVMYPEVLLQEMKRVSKRQIISFPNFAFYKNRLDLLLKGRMPKPLLFGYKWYNTGHIHQFSVKDFHNLMHEVGGVSVEKILFAQSENIIINFLMSNFQNLFQYIPIFILRKND